MQSQHCMIMNTLFSMALRRLSHKLAGIQTYPAQATNYIIAEMVAIDKTERSLLTQFL